MTSDQTTQDGEATSVIPTQRSGGPTSSDGPAELDGLADPSDPASSDERSGAVKTSTVEAKAGETSAVETKAGETKIGETSAVELEEKAADGTSSEPDPEAPADQGERWSAFAPERSSRGRLAGLASRAGQVLSHEWTLAATASLVVAAAMTWPTLARLGERFPGSGAEPARQAWRLAWAGHALLHEPTRLWRSNAFFPDRHAFAFGDPLLGYAPLGVLGSGPAAAAARYSIVLVLCFALVSFGGYALVRQLGGSRAGAAVAAAALAYAPWRFGLVSQLDALSSGAILLSLAMLARGHGWSLRPRPAGSARSTSPVRPGWVLAGWLVAAWQLSLGFSLGLPFGYVLGGVFLVTIAVKLARGRLRVSRWLLSANLGGALVAGLVAAMLAVQYHMVVEEHPSAHPSVRALAAFSPPLRGLVTAPAQSWLWGQAHAGARADLARPAQMALLPGYFLIGLAVAGLVLSIWTRRQRIFLLLGLVASVVFTMGTAGPGSGHAGYLLLYWTLPGMSALRAPNLLIGWTTLLLALLAAGAVSALSQRLAAVAAAARIDGWAWRWLPRLALLPVVLVLLEGAPTYRHAPVSRPPVALGSVSGPILVLPSDDLIDRQVMLWSTDGFPQVVNGAADFTPRRLAELRDVTHSFPDRPSVGLLRELGVRTVIVLADQAAEAGYPQAVDGPVIEFGLSRRQTRNVVVYTLD